jgi:hypothetical protein
LPPDGQTQIVSFMVETRLTLGQAIRTPRSFRKARQPADSNTFVMRKIYGSGETSIAILTTERLQDIPHIVSGTISINEVWKDCTRTNHETSPCEAILIISGDQRASQS